MTGENPVTNLELSEKQIEVINNMSDETRYEHIVNQAKNNQKIWTLSDDKGCLLVDTGEEKCLVVFSHQQLAQAWAEVDHAGCTALEIALPVFLDKWLPGMEKDGFHLAIQPNLEGESILASAPEFMTNFVEL